VCVCVPVLNCVGVSFFPIFRKQQFTLDNGACSEESQ
jgi:hypothetical protein